MNAHGSCAEVQLIVAVKRLEAAKSRLSATLSAARRRSLVLAMLVDTITAAGEVSGVHSITVVTPDPSVAAIAEHCGARVVADAAHGGNPDPLNAALRTAEAAIAAEGRQADSNRVVLQADLPSLTSRELAEALSVARRETRSFVADRRGRGTTALFAFGAPLDPQFGRGSAGRHRESGAIELSGGWPGLRCDVDTAADLAVALQLGVGAATRRVLDQPR